VFFFHFILNTPLLTTAPLCNIGGTITITTIVSEYSFDNMGVNPTATNLSLEPTLYENKMNLV
jgi:hypothetical protein